MKKEDEHDCEYNRSPFLVEKEFRLFRHKKIYFTWAKAFDGCIELGSHLTFAKNNRRFEIYFDFGLLRRIIIINMHDVRVGV
jgi:hypothetical protein